MKKTNSQAPFLFCLALFAMLADTGSAQDCKSTRSRLYVDPFFTDEVSEYSTVRSKEDVQPYESKPCPEVTASDVRSYSEPEPRKSDVGSVAHSQRSIENGTDLPKIDEAVVPPAPLRQRSCRPY